MTEDHEPAGGRGVPGRAPGVSEVTAFVAEICLLAALAVGGSGLGRQTAIHVALAVALPVAVSVLWGLLLAPRSAQRLGQRPRLVVKLALTVLAAVLLAATHSVPWGVALAVLAIPVFTVGELRERTAGP
ncbi:YrdB family protein [Tsukamurella soli]|uniref:DUF2568 domain-containing protein n=1 Tax=Tsukamurella soli TaxID=644556 RepID=A0ABP8KES6_9ACTN